MHIQYIYIYIYATLCYTSLYNVHTYIYKRYLKKEACLFVSLHICLYVCLFDCLFVCLFACRSFTSHLVLNLLEHQRNVVAIDCTILSQNVCGLVTWAQWKHRTIWYSHTYHICTYHIWKKTVIYETYFSNLETICNGQKNHKFSTIRFFSFKTSTRPLGDSWMYPDPNVGPLWEIPGPL